MPYLYHNSHNCHDVKFGMGTESCKLRMKVVFELSLNQSVRRDVIGLGHKMTCQLANVRHSILMIRSIIQVECFCVSLRFHIMSVVYNPGLTQEIVAR